MTNTYTVTAVRWSGGWELHIDGEAVTQVRTLDKARQQVRDYLATIGAPDADTAAIDVRVDLDGLESEVADVRAATKAAAEAQAAAGAQARQIVARLRDAGLSTTDTAVVLGVSRGRVSQLIR